MEYLKIIASSLAALILCLAARYLLTEKPAAGEALQTPTPISTVAPASEATPSPAPENARAIRVNDGGEIREMAEDDYLVCVLAGEVSPDYAPEALKAQAVAARTYLYYKINGGGCANGGDICTSYAHCQAFKSEDAMRAAWGEKLSEYHAALEKAVEETKGEVVVYENKPICALYHSSSVGKTEDCVSVFGGERPYLVSVDSPLEKTDAEYERVLSIPINEFLEKVNDAFSLTLSAPEIRIGSYTAAGRVSTVFLGETSVKATKLRTALGLRSTDFSLEVTKNAVVFTTRGYGHGVGMSQHGAQEMALSGSTYREILTHYYTGTTVEVCAPPA